MMNGRLKSAMGRSVLGMALAGGMLAAACGSSQPAASAPPAGQESANVTVTNEVLDRHMKTFGSQDLAGVMADYAADAVMFTPGGPVKGTDALKAGFVQLFAEWAKPGVKFTLKQRIVEGKNAYIFWDAETADNLYEGAMDAFVVENGKIVAHFFSGKIRRKPPRRSSGARSGAEREVCDGTASTRHEWPERLGSQPGNHDGRRSRPVPAYGQPWRTGILAHARPLP